MKSALYKKHNDHNIIIGCGRLGANLANTLSNDGKSIVIIDQNKESFRKLSTSYGGITLIGNATEIAVLMEAEIDKATSVISVTNNDNTNIMVAQIAKELFHIEQVVARLYDPERECVYQEFDIKTICPAVLSTKEIDKMLAFEHEETEELS
jgi:trk system potassium uptake protein TrkA